MALSLLGVTGGALSGVFTLGIFFPRANAKGAMAGALSSLVGMAVIIFGAQYYTAAGLLKFPGKITSVDGCPANFTASLGFNVSAAVQTYTGIGSLVIADKSIGLIFQLSYLHYCTLGTFIVLTVGIPVSYLTEPVDPKCLDPQLFSPCVRGFLPKKQKFPSKPSTEEYKLVTTDPSPQGLKEPVEPL